MMDSALAKSYYEREDVQRAILKLAKDKEVGTYYDGYFGKRPDVIEYLSDVKAFVKKGIFSFHFSEERWENPLLLGNSDLSEEEKNKNRIGWDLILDLDGVDFVYARIVCKIITEFLDDLGVKNVSVKFSGNKGFHIGIPFEAFSKKIIGYGETKNLFPDAARKIASYLIYELKEKISKAIIENDGSLENISKKYNIPISELKCNDEKCMNLDYMKLIEIDTILISTRHLFRAPYSLHEKSSLVSIPIENHRAFEFQKKEAHPDVVKPEKYKNYDFLRYNPKYGRDADILLMKAYEEENEEQFDKIQKAFEKEKKGKDKGMIFLGEIEYETFDIKEKVERVDFPKTINYILDNKFSDGKKRALFILTTFLYSINWEHENIIKLIDEWNSKQDSKLKDNYVNAQTSWFNSLDKKISTPNFENDNYYKSISIPLSVIEEDKKKFKTKVKNPLHFVYLLLQQKENKKEEGNGKKKKNN